MNEEIEYAEMLEIPVSTVNTVRKKTRRRVWYLFGKKTVKDEKGALIEKINAQMQNAENPDAETEYLDESASNETLLNLGEIPERIDTFRLYSKDEKNFSIGEETTENTPASYTETDEKDGGRVLTKREKRVRIVLGVEFAAACALCGVIFLTNALMPNSGINTFFRSLGATEKATTDNRAYADFSLSPVVNEFVDIELTLSKTGILSFKDEACVYPVCDGTLRSVAVNPDGSYLVTVDYSTSFSGVIDGLDSVYAVAGEKVKANIPIGYSLGEKEVQVTMYSNGELLNCLQLTSENCLVWSAQE